MDVVIVDFFGIVFAFISVISVDCELPPSATQDQSHRAPRTSQGRCYRCFLGPGVCIHRLGMTRRSHGRCYR